MRVFNVYLMILLLLCTNVYAASSSSSSRSSSSFSTSRSSGGFSTSKPSSSSKSSSSFGTSKSSSSFSTSRNSSNSTGGFSIKTTPISSVKSDDKKTFNTTVKQSNSFKEKTGTSVSNYFSKTKKPTKEELKSAASKYSQPRSTRRYEYFKSYTPPVYVNNSPQSFSGWDALMLWAMLDNVSDRNMYYNHANDPGMQAWRKEAEEQAKTNAELKTKLTELDQYVKELESKGVIHDPNYMPDDNQDLWINTPGPLTSINICTSSNVDGYVSYVSHIAKTVKLDGNAIKTNGSIDNIAKLSKQECDLAIIQEDAFNDSLVKIKDFGFEPVIFACEQGSNKRKVYVSSTETGSQSTLNKLKSRLGITEVVLSLTPTDAVHSAHITNACMFTVSNPNNKVVEYMDNLNMELINIPQYDNYVDITIDNLPYKNLKTTNTIATKTILVTTKQWVDSHKSDYDKILTGLSK